MAKNREPEKPELESSEEEEDSSSEETDSEPEPEPEPKSQPQITKKPSPSKPQQPQPPPSSSEEESDSDSDSDSDADSDDEPVASQKPKAKPAAPQPVTPSKSTAKRPAEKKEPETKESKKPKKAEEPVTETKSGDSSKKVLFQRLWSEDDEITILQGMIDYADKKKTSPSADLDDFLEFIRKNLQCDVNKGQLQDKIRRLKKKYENNRSNKRNLTKRHDQEAYALSSKIWDVTVATPNVANEGTVKRTPSRKGGTVENGKVESNAVRGEEVVGNGGGVDKSLVVNGLSSFGLSAEERVLRNGAQLFEGANSGVEGAKVWKRLIIEDMEAHLKQLEVMCEKTRLVLGVLKSGNQ